MRENGREQPACELESLPLNLRLDSWKRVVRCRTLYVFVLLGRISSTYSPAFRSVLQYIPAAGVQDSVVISIHRFP